MNPETITQYINAATSVLGGVDDVVRAFKDMPRRKSFRDSLNQQRSAGIPADGTPTDGFFDYRYLLENEDILYPLGKDFSTKAQAVQDDPSVGIQPDMYIFDDKRGFKGVVPTKVAEMEGYKIRVGADGRTIVGYQTPEGREVLYTK